jgi:hypothetical protein
MPPDTSRDDEELRQYLLGLLPDETMERLDEASIADDGVAARLRVVETDLIDDYVRGQLTGETLARFESWYLSSARRRESVRRAGSFVGAIDRRVARATGASWNDRVASVARLSGMVAAAALVIVVSGSFLFEFVRSRNDSAPTQSVRATAERQTQGAEQQPALQSGAGTPTVERPDTGRAPASVSTSQPIDARRQAGALVAVVLPPPTRTVAPIPTVVVPVGADRVRFELRLESNDFPEYRVGLKNLASGQVLWRSDWVAASASSDRTAVLVDVPANLFGTQHYSLELTGRGAGGRAETIGSYTVRTAQP